MKSREDILKRFLAAQAAIAEHRVKFPDDDELRDIKILMDRLEDEFFKAWPLENTDPADTVGNYAGRYMLDGPHRDLASQIIDVSFDMGPGI